MKNTLLSIFTLLAACSLRAQSTVTIGTGTGAGTYAPIASWYNTSATESIYTATEIGATGGITKLAFQKASGSSTVAPAVKIYLKKTSTASLSADYTVGTAGFAAYTLVYDGTIPNSSTSGWMEVTLQIPFNYTGGQNPAVLVVGSTCIESGRPQYRYTSTTSGSKMSAGYNDGEIACEGNNPFTENSVLEPVWERPNLRITFGALGLDSLTEATDIIVFGNKNVLSIATEKTLLSAVTVYDVQGRQLYSTQNLNTKNLEINTLPQTDGVLLVNVTDSENRQTVKKIIY